MRYSFVYEGPFYLQAPRDYGAVSKAYLTRPGMPNLSSDPGHVSDPLISVIPIRSSEVAARNGNITPQP
jgi:hypothetical protein